MLCKKRRRRSAFCLQVLEKLSIRLSFSCFDDLSCQEMISQGKSTCCSNDMLAALLNHNLHKGVGPIEEAQPIHQLGHLRRVGRLHRHLDDGRGLQGSGMHQRAGILGWGRQVLQRLCGAP